MKNTTATLRAEVEKYAASEIELCKIHAETVAALAEAEAGLGVEALRAVLGEENMPGHAAKAATEAEALANGVVKGVTIARDRREVAIRALLKAEAAEKRQEAAGLRRDATERRKTTDKLLDQLRAFEGVEYAPTSSVGPIRGEATAMGMVLVRAGDETITLANLSRASELEAEAAQLERQEPARNFGAIGTLDDILAALAAEPLTLGPSPLDLAAWIAEAEKEPRAKWERQRVANGLPTDAAAWRPRFEVAYRAGKFAGSAVSAPPVAAHGREDPVPVPAVLKRTG